MRLERTATGIRLTLSSTVREVGIPSGAHVAITRQGSDWFIWINGSLADSFSTNYPIPRKAAIIGPVDTVLDEIRLTLAALYTAPFTSPEVPHQAWYQGNPIIARGRITQGIQLIEGQIGGSKGSVANGSVLSSGQTTGSKGSITDGSVVPNAQMGGSKGQIRQGIRIIPPTVIPGQRQFAKGSVTNGSVIIFGIYPGQQEGSKGFVTSGRTQLFGERWIKGAIFQGTTPEPPPYVPPPGNIIPSQRQFTKGSATFGRVILFDGTLIVPSQRQLTKGSILQGKIDLFGNPTVPNKHYGIQGSLLSEARTTPWTNQQITGQGDPLPPYTGWDPADIVRLMEALRIPATASNLERVQERLNQIQAISPQGQKRIQSLLAHRDELWLELTRTLQPVLYRIDEDTGQQRTARGNPWKNRHRARLINKERKIVEKQIEVATGIHSR